MSKANLYGADLSAANLKSTNLSGAKLDRVFGGLRLQLRQRQAVGPGIIDTGFLQGVRKLRVIERGAPCALLSVHENELVSVRAGLDPVPEVGVARQPMRFDAVAINFVLGELPQVACVRVICCRALARRGTNTAQRQRECQEPRRAKEKFRPASFHSKLSFDYGLPG